MFVANALPFMLLHAKLPQNLNFFFAGTSLTPLAVATATSDSNIVVTLKVT